MQLKFYTELPLPQKEILIPYFASMVRNADPASEFADRNRDLINLRRAGRITDAEFIEELLHRKYDTVLAHEDGKIAGYLGFQREKDGWHGFAMERMPAWAGRGVATAMASLLINTAHGNGVRRCRIWWGNRAGRLTEATVGAMRRLHHRILYECEFAFLLRDGGDYWIEMSENPLDFSQIGGDANMSGLYPSASTRPIDTARIERFLRTISGAGNEGGGATYGSAPTPRVDWQYWRS